MSSANFQRTEQEIASLQKDISATQQKSTASANAPAPGVPLPCTGGTFEGSHGFVIAAQVDKKGEFDTFCAMIPVGCTRLGTLLGKTADQGIRDNTIFHWVDVPDDIAASGGHFEYMFPLNLKYNTQYGLIQLIAVVEDPVTGLTGRRKNPAKPWNANTQQYSYLDTWTTGNALNSPGTPVCLLDPTGVNGDIIENTTYADRDGGHARLTLRAYFSADRARTADQMEATKIGVRLKYAAGGGFLQASAPATLETDKFEDITISDLPEGQQLVWHDVWIKHGTGRAFSAAADCSITAGNTNTDSQQFAAMCTGSNITFVQVDAHHAKATLTYTQPTVPFALKKVQLQRSDDGGATWSIDQPADRPIAEAAVIGGLQTVVYLVKTKAAVNHLFRAHFLARPGLDGFSPSKSSSGVGDATGDSGPASAVTNFTATWEAANVTFKWKRPASNANSIQNYNVWASNTAGTVFMQVLSDGTTKAGQQCTPNTKAGSSVLSGHHLTTKLKKALLDSNFAGGFRIHVSANNYVNGALTEGTEAFFDVTPGVDYLDANDAVNVTNVGQSRLSTKNELYNGHLHYNRSGGACKQWSSSRTLGTWIPPAPSGTGLDFDVVNHRLHWYGFGGGLPIQQLGDPSQANDGLNIDAGDYRTVDVTLYSFNGQHTVSLQWAVRDQNGNALATVPFSATVNGTPTTFEAKLQIPPAQSFAGITRCYLQLEDTSGFDLSPTSDLFLDLFTMNNGQQGTGFSLNPQDTNSSTSTATSPQNTWDSTPAAVPGLTTTPNISPTGPSVGGGATQGGGAALG
ncbi:MAG TPA: hypothetical protein VKJ45_29970, partial [Blastocatellia bacterium]|nr:hypothetical protein [Blastocatellia bacterium]